MADYEGIRLHVYLARCGVASRRKCEELIQDGMVKVDGQVIRRKGYKVTESQRIEYDGKLMRLKDEHIYLALNKPARYLCSNFDSQGRPLASELLGDLHGKRLFHVGRLDFMSSGLIFYTNDGDFANRVMHPSSMVAKEYLVKTDEPVEKDILESFKKGMYIEGGVFTLKSYSIVNPVTVRLTLQEGKNREIRRLFEAVHIRVRTIHRIRIGDIQLGDLPTGGYRRLTTSEIDSFQK